MPRILITDDEPSILSFCREYFRDEGYEVYTALNAEEALEFLSKGPVDVVITDINKPGMNGWELTEIIKKTYDIDVIICTGYHQKGNREKARRIGAFAYLIKPIKLTDLLDSVERAIEIQINEMNDLDQELRYHDPYFLDDLGFKMREQDTTDTVRSVEWVLPVPSDDDETRHEVSVLYELGLSDSDYRPSTDGKSWSFEGFF